MTDGRRRDGGPRRRPALARPAPVLVGGVVAALVATLALTTGAPGAVAADPPAGLRFDATTPLPGTGRVGEPYRVDLDAAGAADERFAVTAGSLPAGLVLDAATGVVSGAPRAAGARTVTVTATSAAAAAPADLRVTLRVVDAGRAPGGVEPAAGRIGGGASVLVDVPGARFTQVSLGVGTGYGLTEDGTLWSWGDGSRGERGAGGTWRFGDEYPYNDIVSSEGVTTTPGVVPLALPPGVTPVEVQGSTGAARAVATDGSVWVWGWNDSGALVPDGDLILFRPVRVDLPGLAAGVRAVEVDGGRTSSVVRTSDGGLWTWGYGYAGETGVPGDGRRPVPAPLPLPGGVRVTQVATTEDRTAVRAADGSVWAWGGSTPLLAPDGTVLDLSRGPVRVPLPVAAAEVDLPLGYRDAPLLVVRGTDGAVWSLGSAPAVRTVPALPPGVALTATEVLGTGEVLALSSDGAVRRWRPGGDVAAATPAPVPLPAGVAAGAVAAGFDTVLVRTPAGEAWGWGGNRSGALGDGTTTDRATPVRTRVPVVPAAVELGGVPATGVRPVDVARAVAVTPEHAAGTVDVVLRTTLAGGSPGPVTRHAGAYTYRGTNPVWTSGQPSLVTVGTPYAWVPAVTATGAPAFAVVAGALPPGLVLDARTGAVTGTATAAGTSTATVRVVDDWGSATTTWTFTAGDVPRITSVPASGTVGTAYRHALMTSGQGATTFALVAGALPPGLRLDTAARTVAGTPTGAGTWAYTLRVTSPFGSSEASFSVVVVAAGAAAPGVSPRSGPPTGGTRVTVDVPGGAWRTVVAGPDHTLALAGDGTVYAWGDNQYCQLGDGGVWVPGDERFEIGACSTPSRDVPRPVRLALPAGVRVTALEAGPYGSVALASDGTVWRWGLTGAEPGFGTSVLDVDAVPTAVPLPGGRRATGISAGYTWVAVASGDGSLWAWGTQTRSRLGSVVESATVRTPVRLALALPTGVRIRDVTAGTDAGAVVATDGSVWTWGADDVGQLGDGGDAGDQPVPVRVRPALPAGVRALAVEAGDGYTLLVASDGSVWGWGRDDGRLGRDEVLGDSTVPDRSALDLPDGVGVRVIALTTPVPGGRTSVRALGTDGVLWAWGTARPAPIREVVPPRLTWVTVGGRGDGTAATGVTADGVRWDWPPEGPPEGAIGGPVEFSTPVRAAQPVTATGVVLGTAAATGLTAAGPARVSVLTPALPAGTVDVRVTTDYADGTPGPTSRSLRAFTVTAP
ncbi:RCC1 domain-containing protein [Cellulomonas marina]|uniref:RCC1 domain-containing protein n=1 Tax=Cellulomonas marina TaxID=988821 RepID=UPI00158742DE|nr:putative Ig domain-containing protein [Cellulomonas marina]